MNIQTKITLYNFKVSNRTVFDLSRTFFRTPVRSLHHSWIQLPYMSNLNYFKCRQASPRSSKILVTIIPKGAFEKLLATGNVSFLPQDAFKLLTF